MGARRDGDRIVLVPVRIKDERGDLLPTAIPQVTVVKGAHQYAGDSPLDDPSRDPAREVEILARIEQNLVDAPLAGFVGEGMAPYGFLTEAVDAVRLLMTWPQPTPPAVSSATRSSPAVSLPTTASRSTVAPA